MKTITKTTMAAAFLSVAMLGAAHAEDTMTGQGMDKMDKKMATDVSDTTAPMATPAMSKHHRTGHKHVSRTSGKTKDNMPMVGRSGDDSSTEGTTTGE
jgi:hypothetical protein